ncbi:MAG TPA: choice-of-anchor E domain-containing protein [Chitinophagaceae bacterium]|nr:choice-of-anchor E domain-containing protein [Chitinophagaceae bacterium]
MNKQLYTIFFVIVSCFAAVKESKAQCSCSNATQPDSIVYNYTLSATSAFNTPISFPKFDPGVGTLTCVTLTSSVTAVSNLSIRNLDSAQQDYAFMYTQAIGFSGPGGLSTLNSTNLFYGPTTLDPYNSGVDSVHYGPDTPFKNHGLSRTITNTAGYLGTGNVTISFTNTGSTLLLQGSNNYQSTVSTFAWGEFRLVYYWCAAGSLPLNIKNFIATKKDDHVMLQWLSLNELPNTRFEILVSTDGRSFGQTNGSATRKSNSDESASYEYRYQPNAGYSGKVFFRLKQIDPNGKTYYSNVKVVDLSGMSDQTISIYPNPIVKNMTVGFASAQTGTLKVEVVNGIGQAVYSRVENVTNQSKIDIRLAQNVQPGTYYLRIQNLKTNEKLVQKIFLQ